VLVRLYGMRAHVDSTKAEERALDREHLSLLWRIRDCAQAHLLPVSLSIRPQERGLRTNL
jgi:hypothetical protein